MDFETVVNVWQTFWPAVAGGGACYAAIRTDMAILRTRLDHLKEMQEDHHERLTLIERRSGVDRRGDTR